MTENLSKQISAFLDPWIASYRQQGPVVKVVIPALLLLVLCCICSIPVSLLPRGSSNELSSPVVFPTDGTQTTPTSLFSFATFTPFPTQTSFVPTAFPTLSPAPTGTHTLTPSVPTATATSIPSATASPIPTATDPPPSPTATRVPSVEIITVNKPAEYVEIQNLTEAPVNLRGWRLVSETGDESCNLRGTLDPDEVLRIWSRRGNPGFNCRLGSDIWLDNSEDPAVLYDSQGEEVSRFP